MKNVTDCLLNEDLTWKNTEAYAFFRNNDLKVQEFVSFLTVLKTLCSPLEEIVKYVFYDLS